MPNVNERALDKIDVHISYESELRTAKAHGWLNVVNKVLGDSFPI